MTETRDTKYSNYCALCEVLYTKGRFAAHKASPGHQAALRDAKSMAEWYKGNLKQLTL